MLSSLYEKFPYVLWISLTLILIVVVRGDLIITVIGGFAIMVISLIIIPLLVSDFSKLGIFGLPCKWGLHKIMIEGYVIKCRRCKKTLLDKD